MATAPTQTEAKIDTAKAEVAAEKAYAAAAEQAPATPVTAPVAKKAVRKPAAKKVATVKKAAAKVAQPAANKTAASKPAVKKPAAKRARLVKAKPAAAPRPPITKLKDTIMAKTQTTTEAFTARVKGAVADAQTRAQATYEKSTAAFGELGEMNKGNLEAVVEAGKVLAAGLQDLGRDIVAESKTAFETLTADVQSFAAVKSPTEFVQLQREIVRRNFDNAVAAGSKRSETLVKLAGDAFAPLSTRFSVVAEKVKQAA